MFCGRFDPNEDVNRYTLWPGKYWVQVLVEDDVLWEVVMTTAGTQGNYPDLFMDEYNTLGLGFNTSWYGPAQESMGQWARN